MSDVQRESDVIGTKEMFIEYNNNYYDGYLTLSRSDYFQHKH